MKRDDYAMPRLRAAQRRRQSILDFLRDHPWAPYDQLVDAVRAAHPDIEPYSVRGLVAAMLKKREIASSGSPRERSYMAVVAATETAEEVRAAYLLRQKIGNAKNAESYNARKREQAKAKRQATPEAPPAVEAPPEKHDPEPWRTVYREGDNPDIRRAQRGQGAVASGVGSIQSCAYFIF